MQNQQLNDYILSQLQAGLTNEDITTQLVQAGWDNETISRAFADVAKTIAPNFSAPPTDTPAQPLNTIKVDDPQLTALESEPETKPQPPAQAVASPITANPQPQTTSAEPLIRQELPPPVEHGRLKTGWLLFLQTFRIIKSNPILFVYVILNMITIMSVFLLAGLIVILDLAGPRLLFTDSSSSNSAPSMLGYGFLLLTGYTYTFLTLFFTTALSFHVLSIFKGNTTSVKLSIKASLTKLPAIMVYALISLVFGYILALIEQRLRFVGYILSKIFGALWSLLTTFTVPIIADTNKNGVAAVGESMRLFKDNWGQTITSRVSVTGFVTLLLLILFIPIFIIIGVMIPPSSDLVAFLIAMLVVFALLYIVIVIEVVVTNVLNVCLYYYAKYGAISPSFDPKLLASAFVTRNHKK